MTLPSQEELFKLLGPETAADDDERLIRTPLHPVLARDWLQDVEATPSPDQTYLLKADILYSGEVMEESRFTGRGCFKFPTGRIFAGEFRDGRRHGPGIEWTPEHRFRNGGYGSLHVHIGHWVRNVREGPGTHFFSNGSVYEGDHDNGMPHGRGVMITRSGLVYDGHWVGGVMEGYGASRWSDDRRYMGQWKAGQCHGQGLMRWPDDTTYKGEFVEGQPHGTGTLTTATGLLLRGTWSHGRRCGTGTVHGLDGTCFIGDWEGPLDMFRPTDATDPAVPEKSPRSKARLRRLFGWMAPKSPSQPPSPSNSGSPRPRRNSDPSALEPSFKAEAPFPASVTLSRLQDARRAPGTPSIAFAADFAAGDRSVLSALWMQARLPIKVDHQDLPSKRNHIPVPQPPIFEVRVEVDGPYLTSPRHAFHHDAPSPPRSPFLPLPP